MDSVKLNAWFQVVGTFALVGSLIFVGLQMSQAQEIALSQAYQTRADQSIAITLTALESDTTLSFWGKAYGNVEGEFTPAESALGGQIALARLVHWENMHYQYRQGFVTEEHWQTELASMRNLIPHPAFRFIYEGNKDSWRRSFREVLDQILEDQVRTQDINRLRERLLLAATKCLLCSADSTGRRNTRAEPFSYGVFSHRAKPDREGPTAKCSPDISQRFRSLPAVLHRCRLEPSMLALIPQHTLRLLRLRQSVASTH